MFFIYFLQHEDNVDESLSDIKLLLSLVLGVSCVFEQNSLLEFFLNFLCVSS